MEGLLDLLHSVLNPLFLCLDRFGQREEDVQDVPRNHVELCIRQDVIQELPQYAGNEGTLILVAKLVQVLDHPGVEALVTPHRFSRLNGDHNQVTAWTSPLDGRHHLRDVVLLVCEQLAHFQDRLEYWPDDCTHQPTGALKHRLPQWIGATHASSDSSGCSSAGLDNLVLGLLRRVGLPGGRDLDEQDEKALDDEVAVDEKQEESDTNVDQPRAVQHEQQLQDEERQEPHCEAQALQAVRETVLSIIKGMVHVVRSPEDACESKVHDELGPGISEDLSEGHHIDQQDIELLDDNVPPIDVRLEAVVEVADLA
mmetsp:Transcript_88696/g.206414  ORF Transcript_88696/g.206414 Transcript_88696/m.206414 type:complete len:312 (-) Transcript_88696:1005-1940(-)